MRQEPHANARRIFCGPISHCQGFECKERDEMTLPLNTPFIVCDWSAVEEIRFPGERGYAYWKTQQYGDVRVRQVRYSIDYCADHWCALGHVLFVLSGKLVTELADGREFILLPGMSYVVHEGAMKHRSRTHDEEALLFIVD